jgi:hypothetical protein
MEDREQFDDRVKVFVDFGTRQFAEESTGRPSRHMNPPWVVSWRVLNADDRERARNLETMLEAEPFEFVPECSEHACLVFAPVAFSRLEDECLGQEAARIRHGEDFAAPSEVSAAIHRRLNRKHGGPLPMLKLIDRTRVAQQEVSALGDTDLWQGPVRVSRRK